MASLVDEARRLVDRGVKELTLLGQNVNGYHGEGADGGSVTLAGLIRELAAIDGLDRIRYMTSHPRDMSDDLIAAHRDEEKLMPFLHLPFQAGSDRVLAAMNRKHTADDYRALIDRASARRGRTLRLSTDIIVGFPRRDGRGFRGDGCAGVRDRFCARVFVQVQPAARHSSGDDRPASAGTRQA